MTDYHALCIWFRQAAADATENPSPEADQALEDACLAIIEAVDAEPVPEAPKRRAALA